MSDYSESEAIAKRMKGAVKRLSELANQVGSARQIREFAGDMRKAALSSEVVKALKQGESAAAAEHIGRASAAYQDRLNELAKQYEAAEQTIAAWTAEQARFDATRSLLSFSKEGMRQL